MNLRKSLLRGFAPAVSALALVAMVSTTAHAASTPIAITTSPAGDSYQLAGGNTIAGYTNGANGYNFALFTATSAVNYGSNAQTLQMANAVNNGYSVLALDADYPNALDGPQVPVTTSLSSLAAGTTVSLTFQFAGAQQLLNSDNCNFCQGNYDSFLGVTLNDATLVSGTNDGALIDAAKGATENKLTSGCSNAGTSTCIASQSFSGWESETLTFTVGSSGSTGLLSFVAQSDNATQVPAFALVDDVAYTTTPPPAPEPNSLILLGTGLAGLGGLVRSRFVKATAKA